MPSQTRRPERAGDVIIEISTMQVAIRGLVWYHTCMSTTQNNTAETSRPCCCVCGADHVDDNVRATPHGDLCVMCVEDVRADMCADAHERSMGYDADEEGALYWDQHAEG